MSARDELPPCECVGGGDPYVMCRPCRDFRHLLVGITREELATMRAAVERCAELETALARITAERDRVTVERDEARGEAESERLRLEILTDYPYKGEPFSWLRATPTEGE